MLSHKNSTPTNSRTADIIIVGAGMVGSLLASLLKDSGLRIILLERDGVTEPGHNASFEPRVSALTRASENLLKHVGAWPLIEQHRFSPYNTMTVWDADGSGKISFSARELGESHLGILLENRLLQWALTHTATQSGNVDFLCPVQLTHMEKLPQGWQLTLADGQKLIAPLVVGADGALSAVRQFAGISTRDTPYQQRAIVTTVRTQKSHQHTAWQRFSVTGPLAFLPMKHESDHDHYCSIVWSQDDAEAERILALDDESFRQELGAAIEHTLGEIDWCDRRFSFPLHARHATDYVREGLALIGDAAHNIHPLAGQGVNLGLLDAAVLAEEILRAQQRNISWHSHDTLTRYQRRRRAHNTLILNSMTGFKRLFGSHNPLFVVVRNIGLSLSNQLQPLKLEFARVAMGLTGDLPQAAQAPKIGLSSMPAKETSPTSPLNP